MNTSRMAFPDWQYNMNEGSQWDSTGSDFWLMLPRAENYHDTFSYT